MARMRTAAKVAWLLGGAIVVGAPLLYWGYAMSQPHPLDGFAQCLADQGATFYGAFWCPRCREQKALFGRAQRFLPYVECSPASGQGMLPVCREAGVRAYPTWDFADGSRQEGVLSLSQLAAATGCELPEAYR